MQVNNQLVGDRPVMNKRGPVVRFRQHEGAPKGTDDRRVRRTQHALVQALVELVLEKRYDSITIQDLLDRADVGRSTFYSHFRGKDDLLLKSFVRMLDLVDQEIEQDDPASKRVAPVRELFQHVGELRDFQQALSRAHVLDRQFQLGVRHMSRTIERRLARRPHGHNAQSIPLRVQAHAMAGALFTLLFRWIEQDLPHTPDEMDTMFHAMWSTL